MPSPAYDADMFHWAGHLREGISAFTHVCRNLLLPPSCVYCRQDISHDDGDVLFCSECFARLIPETWHGCRRCGGAVVDRGVSPPHCPLCRNQPLKFDAAVTLGSYHAGLRDVVLRMKRPSHEALSTTMGRLLADRRHAQLTDHQANVIVPIPMFWRRRLGRCR